VSVEHESSPLVPNQLPRFHYIPWFLRPFSIAVSAGILAVCLSVALTLLVNDNILEKGFAPRVSTELLPSVDISPAAFLWSFLPSLLADQYRHLMKSIDTFYRLVQPYADLKRKDATARQVETAFTINYTNDLPVFIFFKAVKNFHLKVAFISSFSLFSSFIPAAASNMFYVFDDGVRNRTIVVWRHNFYIVIAYMAISIITLIVLAPPDETRHMPHDLETIFDHLSFLSRSSLLNDERYQYTPETVKSGGKIEQLKHFMKQSWKEAKPWYVPEPVQHVVRELSDAQKSGPVRFGISQKGDSFSVGIDVSKESKDDKFISLHDEDYYKWNPVKRAKEEFL
jgi:hypothetical protein